MANDSGLFRMREDLKSDGWLLSGIVFEKGNERMLPLYEAKMIRHYDHRWASYDIDGTSHELKHEDKNSPSCPAIPRYWLQSGYVTERLGEKKAKWLLGWRDICRSTDERTVIAAIMPLVAVGHTCPLVFFDDSDAAHAFLANLSSFCFDFVARQKIGGTHLTYGLFKQLPVIRPDVYREKASFDDVALSAWISQRVFELTYTAHDLKPFAEDCGYTGPPFKWDPHRRFLIRCELDAAYFHLYSIDRDDVDYIMETFPIVKRKDESAHGEYRTKRVILEMYDAMAEAMRTGEPYQTKLDPPPGDRRAAHDE